MTASLYWHALRAARPRQVARRASRPVRRRLFPRASDAVVRPLEQNRELWQSRAFDTRSSAPSGRLETFTAHYGEGVLAAARERAGADALRLAEGWIHANPPSVSDAWHPYVVSTRVANWIAAVALAPELATPLVAQSLRRQVDYVRRNVEDDVLGNHVIRNAKALVLGGAAFGDEGTMRVGRRLLARELPEQLLPDGGHYERSPAYHRLVLLDLLEVAAWCDIAEPIERARGFAVASSRPDGAPALFNDGGLDIAPHLDLPAPGDGVDVREQTGYVFLRSGDVWLAFDCGPPSPPYLPAHAHADALSFQLWHRGRPVVVDTGTSTYEPGAQRAWERGTPAHSTVAVNGDQFRLWGAFRSGPLPTARLVSADASRLEGELQLRDGVRVRRTIHVRDGGVEVEDLVHGRADAEIVSTLVLAADAPAVVNASEPHELEERTIAERFGDRTPARAAVVRRSGSLPWEGGWSIAWAAHLEPRIARGTS